MPLEHIVRAMEAQAESEIAKIAQAAETESGQLIAEAEAAAQALRARHLARVRRTLNAESAELQNKAKLAALRARADAREQLLIEAFARAERSLAELRESKDYPALFRALAVEAIHASGLDRVAQVDPRDLALARAVFAELGVPIEIETQAVPLGGLLVRTEDTRIVVNNTLAARLERARKPLRGPISRILT